MATVNVTDETFDAEVKQSSVPVIVDFWAEWCGPCKQIAPVLEELSAEFGDNLKIAKVDIDSNPNEAAALAVRSIPTLFMFKDGQVVESRTGSAPISAMREWVNSHLG